MTKIITFGGKSYVAQHTTDIASRAHQSVEHLSGPQQVDLYNLVSSNLGRGRVKRFADGKSGARRTWAILTEWAEQPDEGAPKIAPKLADAPTNRDLVQQLSDTASRGAAQTALRNSPPSSDNPAKDAEMPALRKAVKLTDLKPKAKVYPRKAGSKQAVLIDLLSRKTGATFGELYDGLAETGKPWRGVTIRSGLAWDVNHIAGYGVTSELLNGEAFAAQGRTYEARRLGVVFEGNTHRMLDGYDPELRLAVYRLVYPAGMDKPLPHTPRKS